MDGFWSDLRLLRILGFWLAMSDGVDATADGVVYRVPETNKEVAGRRPVGIIDHGLAGLQGCRRVRETSAPGSREV